MNELQKAFYHEPAFHPVNYAIDVSYLQKEYSVTLFANAKCFFDTVQAAPCSFLAGCIRAMVLPEVPGFCKQCNGFKS